MKHARSTPIFALTLALLGCGEAPAVEPIAAVSEPVINGTVASGIYTGVAARGGGCSSVLVAPRVMLTSGHCVQDHVLGCTTLATNPLDVVFAETNGGWSNEASHLARTRTVRHLVWRPEIFDLSECPLDAEYNCGNPVRQNIDHSKELVVLYLHDDAPADVTPLPIMISSTSVDMSESAAEIGVFDNLENWVNSNDPVVTTVGYGAGSHDYDLGSIEPRGRDYGLQRWVNTSSSFAGYLGTDDCDNLSDSSTEPGVVVSPKDLTFTQIGDPKTVAPGTQYPGFQHSHSGGGDSGGPVLVGAGAGAKGDNPTSLPAPGGSDSYDPDKNYIVGTASLWVSSGNTPRTAFTPTFTYGAATFLAAALRDTDGDGFADPVDDDTDNDTCDDDEDLEPNQGSDVIGSILHINCTPHSSAWKLSQGADSDGDGTKNCLETDDDDDGVDDELDNCPAHEGPICFKVGSSCPWNPIFFDCILAGCAEFLRFMNVVNPDPTRSYDFPIRSAAERIVVVSPAPGLSVEQSAAVLAGQAARAARLSSEPRELFTLDVIGPERDVRGTVAAYDSRSVRVGNLRGANALELRFGADGQSIEIHGARIAAER